ncbi:glycosyltransferase [Aquabacterium humicola]|uniref:glycosyltransferase n=1 Tax=Aquabacterium humicola TaxID=3237377 RepID=UPI002543BA96|nr:glycosyltransferase [Rubrivivax pictus]
MRIVYATCSGSSRLDDDAGDFALGLARMAQHAGHRVDLLVQVPAGEGERLRRSTIDGVPVVLLAADAPAARSGAVAEWLDARQADVVHLLDSQAASFASQAGGDTAPALVVNVDDQPAYGGDATRAGEALLRRAACRIAPDLETAARLRGRWPELTFDVVIPGVDLLAIAAGRRLDPAAGPPCVGWAGGPWPTLEHLLEQLGLRARPLDGRPAERQGTLHAIDLLCLRACAARRLDFEAQAAGVPVLRADDDAAGLAEALVAWAADAALRAQWRRAVRPPPRIEETAFLYESLYRRAVAGR